MKFCLSRYAWKSSAVLATFLYVTWSHHSNQGEETNPPADGDDQWEMSYDAIVVGGSYAGLSAAMQLARAGRSTCIVDDNKPRNRFTDSSHGFFGQDDTPPFQMLAQARSKVMRYPSVHEVSGTAVSAGADGKTGFQVVLSSGQALQGKKLLLAFGNVDILPEVPGIAERWGKSVLHCPYCHGFEFKDQQLGVLYMHPLSLHQALLVPDWGPTTLFLNGQSLPDDDSRAHLQQRNVKIESAKITRLEGDSPQISGVRLADERVVPISALYIGPRTEFRSHLPAQLGCAIEDGPVGPVIKTDAGKMTTAPGVYAAGDIALQMSNATFASSDGVLAGGSLHRALIFDSLR